MRKIILILFLGLVITSCAYADIIVKGNYKVLKGTTVYTNQLQFLTVANSFPKLPTEGQYFKNKKTGRMYRWKGKTWVKSTKTIKLLTGRDNIKNVFIKK